MSLRRREYLARDKCESKNVMTYAQAKSIRDKLSVACDVAEAKLKAMSGSVDSLGLVPDSVKDTTEWQKAYKAERAAFIALRNHNGMMAKLFKREMAAERDSTRRMRVASER